MNRKQLAITGAAVADAASLGLHWLYDQKRIRSLEPNSPEFHVHTQSDYQGFPGFFAHENRFPGQLSHYGEQMLTMLRSLSEQSGHYDQSHYQSAFEKTFGFGGTYVGYIDHVTRNTLNNITDAQNNAVIKAESLLFNGSDIVKRRLITKILSIIEHYPENEFRIQLESAVRITDDDDELVAHAFKMLDVMIDRARFHGADDQQLPAISKLPALVAAYCDDDQLFHHVESAIRVTNNNEYAVKLGIFSARLLQIAIETGNLDSVVDAALSEKDPLVAPLMNDVLEQQDVSTPVATAHWGMACDLKLGIPSIVHNLTQATSFAHGIRSNIYSGGDSCGRSILLGAILGACFEPSSNESIPEAWSSQLHDRELITTSSLFLAS